MDSQTALTVHKKPAELVKDFDHLVKQLEGPIHGMPDGKEKARAKQLEKELTLGMAWVTRSKDEERPHHTEKLKNELTELERLLAGQQMLFEASAARVARRFLSLHTTEIFKHLLDIVDSVEASIANDMQRQMGIKPVTPPKAKGPKAPKTYKQAQDQILIELHKAGWAVSGDLKIPHATNKEGTFRLWFKPQAIYFSAGPHVKNFGEARSMWSKDYRFEDPAKFAKGLEAYAAKHSKGV